VVPFVGLIFLIFHQHLVPFQILFWFRHKFRQKNHYGVLALWRQTKKMKKKTIVQHHDVFNKSLGGARGQPAPILWLPCRAACIQKTSLYAKAPSLAARPKLTEWFASLNYASPIQTHPQPPNSIPTSPSSDPLKH